MTIDSSITLRQAFLLYGDLPVQYLPSEGEDKPPKLTDGTMPVTSEAAKEATQGLKFPSNFLWGAATAAYQIEGGLHHCNWSMWEEQGTRLDGHATVEHHEKAGKACNSWELFDKDLDALKKLGATMYRFSVEWSRIEPKEGEFDEAVLKQYGDWCQELKEAGIEPMVTLHHFTEPAWFVEKGGWEKRENLLFFQMYVQQTTQTLAPHVKYWSTINELNGYAICGWLAGVHPPGKKDDVLTMLTVFRHLLVAHTMASKAIRANSALQKEDPIVCMALSHVYFLPFDTTQIPKPEEPLPLLFWILNRILSTIVSLFFNYVFNLVILDAIFRGGRFPNFPFPFHFVASLAGWGKDLEALKDTCDWMGVNHYYRSYVQFGMARQGNDAPQQASPTDMFVVLPFGIELRAAAIPNFEKNEMGWDLTPSSMVRLLEILSDRYPSIPIIITESGTADTTDRKRIRYLASLLKQMHSLLEQKRIDLRGYLIWTLMDNFEWAEGFRPKFGLLETNFETFERKERKGSCDMLRAVFGASKEE